MKRWEFTGETKTTELGVLLKRIRATEDFTINGGHQIAKGSLGGWIENEGNLQDSAWVSDNAQVYGNARVSGNAQVCSRDAYLTIGPIGSRDDVTTFFACDDKQICVVCGCFYGTLGEFRAKVKATHGDNKHAKAYLLAADLAETKIEMP